MLTDIIYIGYWWPHLSTGQIFAARWELVGKHKSREHRRRDCVTRATVAKAIDVKYASGYPTKPRPTKACRGLAPLQVCENASKNSVTNRHFRMQIHRWSDSGCNLP